MIEMIVLTLRDRRRDAAFLYMLIDLHCSETLVRKDLFGRLAGSRERGPLSSVLGFENCDDTREQSGALHILNWPDLISAVGIWQSLLS